MPDDFSASDRISERVRGSDETQCLFARSGAYTLPGGRGSFLHCLFPKIQPQWREFREIEFVAPYKVHAMTTHRLDYIVLTAILLHAPFFVRAEDVNKEALSEDSPEEAARKNAELKKKLDRLVSVEFVETPMGDVVAFLTSLTKATIVFDPKATAAGKESTPVDFRVQDMRLANALKWVAVLSDLETETKGGVIRFKLADPKNADLAKSAPAELSDVEKAEKAAIAKTLERKVSFEFVDTPFNDAIGFLRSLANSAFIVDPAVLKNGPPMINLRVKDMKMDQALEWILKLCELEYEIRDQAIFISKQKSRTVDAATKVEPKSDSTPKK